MSQPFYRPLFLLLVQHVRWGVQGKAKAVFLTGEVDRLGKRDERLQTDDADHSDTIKQVS